MAGSGTTERIVRVVIVGACLVVIAAVLYSLVVWERFDRVDVRLPGSPPNGTTYLIVGSDSRASVDTPKEAEELGTSRAVPGARADLVLLVRTVEGRRPTILSLPRDLLVLDAGNGLGRLALRLLEGPQALVDAVCRSLGVGVDHLVELDFEGFRGIVDEVGGVDLRIPRRLWDTKLNWKLGSGLQHLDGRVALMYVRARHLLEWDGTDWVPTDPRDDRGVRARTVLACGVTGLATVATPAGATGAEAEPLTITPTQGQPGTVIQSNVSCLGVVSTTLSNAHNIPVATHSVSHEVTPGGGSVTVPGNAPAGNYKVVVTCEDYLDLVTYGPITFKVITKPGVPRNVSVTPGNARFAVSFLPPLSNGGLAITSYTATCVAPGKVKTLPKASSPIVLTGVTNGVTYSCSVRAKNALGFGPASPPVPVRAGVPLRPGTVSNAKGVATKSIKVAWTAASSFPGAPITGYAVLCKPTVGALRATNVGAAARNVTLQSLNSSLFYRCQVAGKNRFGTGPARVAPASVKPK